MARAVASSDSGAPESLGPNSCSRRGKRGEDCAIAYLLAEGYEIVARNFRKRGGEIDIIACKGDLLAFIEVKAWNKYGLDALYYSVNKNKIKRIVETSKIFILDYRKYNGMQLRFDLIFVKEGVAQHFKAAFTGDI